MNSSFFPRLGLIVGLIASVFSASAGVGFDSGPPYAYKGPYVPNIPSPFPEWETLFAAAPLAAYVAASAGRLKTDFGPVYYRGRLDGKARILIVGPDPDTDEILAQRNLVGLSGQKVQGLLKKFGITKSYIMFNTFLFPVSGTLDAQLTNVLMAPEIFNYRNQLLYNVIARNRIQAIISFGPAASTAVSVWPGKVGIPWFDLADPSLPDSSVLPNWNSKLSLMKAAIKPDDVRLVNTAPYGRAFVPSDLSDIPRTDLPFGIPDWHGAGGVSRSQNNVIKEIEWTAP